MSRETAREALKKHFGHDDFRPRQEEIVQSLVAGHSTFALLPTGAGKSICYQLSALLRRDQGTALVISPLIALMQDQVERMKARGIAAARLDSTLTQEEAAAVLSDFRHDRLAMLYLAPERLLNPKFLAILATARISMLAVDEAHCISEWGHHFRPDYLRISKVARDFQMSPVLALTATATPTTAKAIQASFGIQPEHVFQTSFMRPNLFYKITPAEAEKRLPLLCQALRPKNRRPAIVYVTLQETAEWVATHLAARKFKAKAYHAGLADEHRAEAQTAFMKGKIDVIVATIAFGMGIDKANVRSVAHFNLPKSLENYQQETGRAGRDGEPAHCEVLACGDDQTVLENFVHGDRPSASAVRSLLDFLLRQGSEIQVSPYQLAGIYDIRPGVLETVLTLLELDGVLTYEDVFYETWEIRLLRPLPAILGGRDLAERLLFQNLLASGEPGLYGRTRVTLSTAAEMLDQPVAVLQKFLEDLKLAGDLALRPWGHRLRYSVKLNQPIASLAQSLCDRFSRQETHDLSRIGQVIDFAESSQCLTQQLLDYFGENHPQPCGNCAPCRGENASNPTLPQSHRASLSVADVEKIVAIGEEKHPSLRSPRSLARFLCGISSPAAAREKLTRHEAFGYLRLVPFQTVLNQIHSLSSFPQD